MYRRSLLVAAGAVLALALASPRGRAGDDDKPVVFPPDSHPYGHSYGEWSAAWWQWAFSLPVDQHPLFETADCSAGQSGKVWFLGGTFVTIDAGGDVMLGKATRHCTIPHGKALFFPIQNVEASTLEYNVTTEAALRTIAEMQEDAILERTLECTIDGRQVRDLDDFEFDSPLFTFGPLPVNNLLSAPKGVRSHSVSDGFYVMVAPLSPGKHTIHFSGTADYTPFGGPVFMLDITYHLTVKGDD